MRPRSLSWIALLLLSVAPLSGQVITYEDQLSLRAPTTTGETGLFTIVTGDTLERGDWSFAMYLDNYDWLAAPPTDDIKIPRRDEREDRLMDVEETRVSAAVGYGITDRWEIAFQVPYVTYDQNAGDHSGYINGYPYAGKFDENGFDDVRLSTKFGLLDPTKSPARLAASAFLDLPSGDDDGGISTGEANFGAGLHWNYKAFALGTTYKVMIDREAQATPSRQEFDMPNEWRIDAGANIPLRPWPSTNWINELSAIVYHGGDRAHDDPVYLVSGIRHWFGTSGWSANVGMRANLTMWASDNTSCFLGGLIGISYAPLHAARFVPPPPAPVVMPEPPPPPAPVAPPPEPVAPPRQPQTIRTDEIQFEPGSARLTNIAKAILDDVALRMKQEPTATALVIGYTDDREKTGPAKDLDKRRAQAVRDYLVSRHGIDPTRITLEAHGTENPAADNGTADGRKKNRRVVIKLILP